MTAQAAELLRHGCPGLHFYTLNQSRRRAPSSSSCARRVCCPTRGVSYSPAMSSESVETAVAAILSASIPSRSARGLERTPARVARAVAYMTQGYEQDPKEVINGALFTEQYSEMIVVRDIDFYSLCEHHILPFFGKATWRTCPQPHRRHQQDRAAGRESSRGACRSRSA
jgi:hypothetical protein